MAATLWASRGTVTIGDTNTTTLVTNIQSNTSQTLAANAITAQTVIKVEADGTWTAASGWSSNKIDVVIGGYRITHLINEIDSVTPTDEPWHLEAYLSFASIGTNTTVTASSRLTYRYPYDASYPLHYVIQGTGGGTLNSTITNVLDVQALVNNTEPLTITCRAATATELGRAAISGTSSGTALSINGASASAIDFNSTTPAAAEGATNYTIAASGSSVVVQGRRYAYTYAGFGTNNLSSQFVVVSNQIPAGLLRAGDIVQWHGVSLLTNAPATSTTESLKLIIGSTTLSGASSATTAARAWNHCITLLITSPTTCVAKWDLVNNATGTFGGSLANRTYGSFSGTATPKSITKPECSINITNAIPFSILSTLSVADAGIGVEWSPSILVLTTP